MNRRAYQKPLRIIAAMTAVILGGGATIAVATATAANAAELSGVITNIDYAQPMPDPFPVGTTARFVADWTLPDSAQPGDTFTITLPTELAGTPATFPLVVPGTTEAGICQGG